MTALQMGITIAVCTAATMLTRFLPFLIFSSKDQQPPEVVRYLGRVLPAAIFGMLIVYCLKGVSLTSGSHGIPEAIEAILLGRSRLDVKVAVLKPLSSAIAIGTESGQRLTTSALTSRHTAKFTRKTEYEIRPSNRSGAQSHHRVACGTRSASTSSIAVSPASRMRSRQSSANASTVSIAIKPTQSHARRVELACAPQQASIPMP